MLISIIYIYDNTTESATIRNLFVDVYMENAGPYGLLKNV